MAQHEVSLCGGGFHRNPAECRTATPALEKAPCACTPTCSSVTLTSSFGPSSAWSIHRATSGTGITGSLVRSLPTTRMTTVHTLSVLLDISSPNFPGIIPYADGTYHGPRLTDATHPNLRTGEAMISVPRVQPGDMVFWHCVCSLLERRSDPSEFNWAGRGALGRGGPCG